MSVCAVVFEEVVSEASVFARPLKRCEFDELGPMGDGGRGDGSAGDVGWVPEEVSELYDCDLEVMGTIKL
jgi:hypothetical protein